MGFQESDKGKLRSLVYDLKSLFLVTSNLYSDRSRSNNTKKLLMRVNRLIYKHLFRGKYFGETVKEIKVKQ